MLFNIKHDFPASPYKLAKFRHKIFNVRVFFWRTLYIHTFTFKLRNTFSPNYKNLTFTWRQLVYSAVEVVFRISYRRLTHCFPYMNVAFNQQHILSFREYVSLIRSRSSFLPILYLQLSATYAHDCCLLVLIKLIRGVNTNKCECVNKMTTIRARRMFIS